MKYSNRVMMIVAVLLLSATAAFSKSHAKHRIIVQLSNADTMVWKATMHNLKNIMKGWGNDVAIELVAHGPGIGFLVAGKTTQQEAITQLKAQGVQFVACENTMREKKIDKSQLVSEAGTVPMGVGEIILKQEEGWSYLKAGF